MIEHLPLILSALTLVAVMLNFADRIKKKGGEDSQLCDRVSTLEKTVSKTSEDISKIKDNHLAHIQRDMNSMKNDITEIKTSLKFMLKEE